MKMSHLASKLMALQLELSKDLFVHLILISLSAHFNRFKANHNCQKEKWTLNPLISYCVQEEEKLKQDKIENAHLASTSKDNENKERKVKRLHVIQLKRNNQRNLIVFFWSYSWTPNERMCQYHAWRAKKCTTFVLVCSKVN